MDKWAFYLRKSRKDIEVELQGAGETLRRHRQELDKSASNMKIKPSSIDIYTEIVSGDSIATYPEIQKPLKKIAYVSLLFFTHSRPCFFLFSR